MPFSAITMGAFMAHADLHAKIISFDIRRLMVLQSVLWAGWRGTRHRSEGGMVSGKSNGMVSGVWYEVGVGVGLALLLSSDTSCSREAWEFLAVPVTHCSKGCTYITWRSGDCSCNITRKLAG